jgi:hypothetical protein
MMIIRAYRSTTLTIVSKQLLECIPAALKLALSVAILLAFAQLGADAQIAQRATGCPAPTISANAHHWYCDPINGSTPTPGGTSPAGDGSAQHPWGTFASVANANLISSQRYSQPNSGGSLVPLNPNGPIKPGDVIHLLPGNHGNVQFNDYANPAFISVVGDWTKGKTQPPVISTLKLYGCWRFSFQHVVISSLAPPAPPGEQPPGGLPGYAVGYIPILVTFSGGWMVANSDQIYFANNEVYSIADASAWTQNDWLINAQIGLSIRGTTNITVSECHIRNTRSSMYIIADISPSPTVRNVLIDRNFIDGLGNDGLRYAGSYVTISRNILCNFHYLGDQDHLDGMQGVLMTTVESVTQHDIVIDSNYIAAYTNNYNSGFIANGTLPNTPGSNQYNQDSALQGIDNFTSGTWTNMLVTNNVVLITAYHGITLVGTSNSAIVNNTVGELNVNVLPAGYTNNSVYAWIDVAPGTLSNTGATVPSTNVVVRNNVSPAYILNNANTSVTADHNITTLADTPTDPSKCFVNFNPIPPNPPSFPFDLRPARGSPLIGAGSTTLAPQNDIVGDTRTPPIDVGAYAANAASLYPNTNWWTKRHSSSAFTSTIISSATIHP